MIFFFFCLLAEKLYLDLFQSLQISSDHCTFPLNDLWVSPRFVCVFVLIGSGAVYLHSMLHGRLDTPQNHITHTIPKVQEFSNFRIFL